MKNVNAEVDRILDLAEAVCDDTATESDYGELNALVLTDENVRRSYWDYCQMHVMLEMDSRLHRALQKAQSQEHFSTADLKPWESDALAGIMQPMPPMTLSPHSGIVSSVYNSTISFFSQEIPFALLIATVLTGLGLWAGSLIYVSHHAQLADKRQSPSHPSQAIAKPQVAYIGRITGMVDVRWSDTTTAAVTELVALGRKYALASGLMEITYDTGAKVILQGPCTYEADSPVGGFLSVGKLTARLEKKQSAVSGQPSAKVAGGQWSEKAASGQWPGKVASETNPKSQNPEIPKSPIPNPSSSPAPRPQSPAPMFAVRTPTAVVTDLGTEFGVDVDKSGTTTSHVFRGLVRMQAVAADGKTEQACCTLRENETACVENSGGTQGGGNRLTMLGQSAKHTSFVRHIPQRATKSLDLVDIVAGGDGFSGRRGHGIHPLTGQVITSPQPLLIGEPIGDHRYHRVPEIPYIDGIFIPDGSQGPVQLDSAGHTFEWFLATANKTWGLIWAGGVIPSGNVPYPAVLGDIDYSASDHGLLAMHANKGITFNLEAIRQANPKWQMTQFVSVVGNTSESSTIDVWIFVDGQKRFQRRQLNRISAGIYACVPIKNKDHFLTLVCTDANDGISGDWCIFGDPHIELISTELPLTPEAAGNSRP